MWGQIFDALIKSRGVLTDSVDATHNKAHRSAAAAKRGGVSSALGTSHLVRTTKNDALRLIAVAPSLSS